MQPQPSSRHATILNAKLKRLYDGAPLYDSVRMAVEVERADAFVNKKDDTVMRPYVTFSAVLLQTFLILSIGCTQETADSKKARHKERATQYFEKGEYREAIIEFKNVVQLDPLDADAHYRQGLSHLKLGTVQDLREAVKALTTTVELNATNLDAQIKLGQLLFMANDPANARKRAEIVLASASDHKEGHALRGLSLVRESRLGEGIAELKKAIELDPTNISLFIDLARAQVQAKDVQGAEATLLQALKTNPQSLEARLVLGDFYQVTGKPGQAEAEYKRAVAESPDRPEPHIKLAGFYITTQRLTEAETVYVSWARAKPQDENPLVAMGDFYRLTGQLDKAATSYQQAVTVNPKSTAARDRVILLDIDTNKLDEAERQTKSILEANPKDPSGLLFDGRLKLARNQLDAAITTLQSLKALAPQVAGAYHYLGIAYVKKKDLPQAVIELKEALKLAPTSVDSHAVLAGVYLSQGSADLAIEQAQATLQLNPRHTRIATLLGEAYTLKGDTEKAKQVFQALLKTSPTNSIVSHRLGLIARSEKHDAEALQYFEQALKHTPDFIEALAQIVSIKAAQSKFDDAKDRLLRHKAVFPNNPHIYVLLGQLLVLTNDYGQAEGAFKQAIELNDNVLDAYTGLAGVYLKRGHADEAIKEFKIALSKNPKLIGTYTVLGMIYESQKKYDEAQASYQEALKINPRFAPAANNLAWLMMERGENTDVALSYAQTAREVSPNDPSIADTLGWIYYQKKVYLQAASLLKEAAEKLPNEPLVHFHYGMALFKNGNKSEAVRSLERSLQLNVNHSGAAEAKTTLSALSSS